MNASWPELVDELAKEPCDEFVVDGEIVAFEGARTSYSRLQDRIQTKNAIEARKSGIAAYLQLRRVSLGRTLASPTLGTILGRSTRSRGGSCVIECACFPASVLGRRPRVPTTAAGRPSSARSEITGISHPGAPGA